MSNDWKRVTQPELDELVKAEVVNFSSEAREAYENHRVTDQIATVRRSEMYGDEPVFVVARWVNWIVYYDDVEDEFCRRRTTLTA